MQEATVYEAACEVREAILTLATSVEDQTARLESRELSIMGRRDHFAAALMAEFVRHKLTVSHPVSLKDTVEADNLVRLSWQLADALDQGDPRRKSKVTSTAEADEERTIDLAEATPEEISQLYKGRSRL